MYLRASRQYIREAFAHDHVRHTLLRRAFAVIYSYGGGFVSLDADLPN